MNIFNDYIFEISLFHWSKCTIECAICLNLISKSAQARCVSDWSNVFQVYFLQIKLHISEKATNSCKISTVDLFYVVMVKSTVEISQNFAAFSEYINFTANDWPGGAQFAFKKSQLSLRWLFELRASKCRQFLQVWGCFTFDSFLSFIVLCYSCMHPNAACDWWKMDACKILPYSYLDSHSKVMHPEYSKHWRYLLASTIHLLICTWFLKNQFEKISSTSWIFSLFRTGFLLPV